MATAREADPPSNFAKQLIRGLLFWVVGNHNTLLCNSWTRDIDNSLRSRWGHQSSILVTLREEFLLPKVLSLYLPFPGEVVEEKRLRDSLK